MKNLKNGDKVKTCDGLILEVLYADESTVETYERRRYHPTKVFPVYWSENIGRFVSVPEWGG